HRSGNPLGCEGWWRRGTLCRCRFQCFHEVSREIPFWFQVHPPALPSGEWNLPRYTAWRRRLDRRLLLFPTVYAGTPVFSEKRVPRYRFRCILLFFTRPVGLGTPNLLRSVLHILLTY